ncbi:serine/threonine-protein kinase STY8-like isoform X2 [Asparagus officinalis]|uniref:serine/threonine-protein kinase STY8-like isoform X2 n=1 Tax=Asparagus officinalis TaxID=4686 RepID=UPI00098E676D|nr:serine/threonine-protein kinase STY8-like isoform X2 [Asparagus officinalis]XP_020267194.1 serine/threonine-protein kinase STY8-like isoform X2 [Asparagus officinalis]
MSTGRFKLGKQSSLAPDRDGGGRDPSEIDLPAGVPEEIGGNIRLMYLANEGDVEGIRELLESGVDVNFRDIDGRTALHVAACQGRPDVVEILLAKGANVDIEDQWGSTPLADAIHYKNHEVIKLLEKYGAKLKIAPMHVNNAREIPEYEINPSELDFSNSVQITKGTFRVATWRGSEVAVKTFGDNVITDEDKVRAFRDELALLQRIRHPNVVQFLGAVTQSSPMMIVTEYLPKGDLRAFLKQKGALHPSKAVRFALDIARGMNYLHDRKPEAIIHRDLEPSNILRDDSGHLKVADFDVSKLLKVTKRVREDRPLTCQDTACRYVAPEVFRNEEYDTKVDVFSFSLILQEMIEGCPPFSTKLDSDVPKAFASKERPPFRAPLKFYSHGLKELIEQCWSENPADRPTFREIIDRLTYIQNHIAHKRRWKAICCLGC